MSTNIIADVAGRFDELMLLVEKMPKGDYIFLGDLVDRGQQSKEVVDWVMKNAKCVLGNHEHLMIDRYREQYYYEPGTWYSNGGRKTVESFVGPYGSVEQIDEKYIKWMESLPKYLIVDGVFLAHSFITEHKTLEDVCNLGNTWDSLRCDDSIIWNRQPPCRRPEYKLQIAGHNSQFGHLTFSDAQGDYALCLDDSSDKKLTGLHLETMTIYQQDYLK